MSCYDSVADEMNFKLVKSLISNSKKMLSEHLML